jgi:hypothetical protein
MTIHREYREPNLVVVEQDSTTEVRDQSSEPGIETQNVADWTDGKNEVDYQERPVKE